MASLFYIKEKYVPEGLAVKVIERDVDSGALLNEYIGYRKGMTYTLYPKYNPYAKGYMRKRLIADALVRLEG